VHVDPLLPVRPLSVADNDAVVSAGILDEDDRVELLEGARVESVVEVNVRSRRIDLSLKTRIYAAAGAP